jgi:hypothetical protein
MKFIGLLILHIISLYLLRLLWKDKNEGIKRGRVLTKAGLVSLRKSPRWFYFSVWVDFIILLLLYMALIVYSIFLLFS